VKLAADIWLAGAIATLLLLRWLEESGRESRLDVVDLILFTAVWPVTLTCLAVDWLMFEDRP
jgi:hypothetical protein